MNVLTGVGILILSMLIMAFLQLKSGVFLIFSHHASGIFSRQKASDLALFFILGCESIVALLFVVLYAIITAILGIEFNINFQIVGCVLVGIMVALGIVFPIFYYRKGKGTQLFISRNLAKSLSEKACAIKNRSDAFIVGLVSAVPELVFTLPLYFICTILIIELGETATTRSAIILLFILSSVIPLFVIHILFSTDHNLAEIEKKRIKNKNFFRFLISVLYLLIAILLLFRIYS